MNTSINNTDPELDAGKENPFTVPENFFENFPSRLQDKINNQESTEWNLRPAFAVILLILLVSTITFFYQPSQPTSTEIAEITYDELESSGYITEYSIAMLAEQIETSGDTIGQIEQYLIEYSDEDLLLNAL